MTVLNFDLEDGLPEITITNLDANEIKRFEKFLGMCNEIYNSTDTQKFQFSNVVVVEGNMIGVVVKSWADNTYEVYVRSYNRISTYPASEMRHHVYDKELEE